MQTILQDHLPELSITSLEEDMSVYNYEDEGFSKCGSDRTLVVRVNIPVKPNCGSRRTTERYMFLFLVCTRRKFGSHPQFTCGFHRARISDPFPGMTQQSIPRTYKGFVAAHSSFSLSFLS
jgi:hypothetical protein